MTHRLLPTIPLLLAACGSDGGADPELEQDGFTLGISFQVVDDAVLGSPSFCRN